MVNTFLDAVKTFNPVYWAMEESPNAAFLVPREFRRFIKATDHGLYQERKRLVAGNYPDVEPTSVKWKIHPAIRAHEKKAFNKNMKHSKYAQSCCQWFGRRLTTWELKILMGFPPEYEFFGDYDEQCVQIGNAVCPPVAKAVANAMKNGKPRMARAPIF